MKIVCDRKQLLAALGQVGGVVPARSPKPILTNVRLTAEPMREPELEATDLEVGIRMTVPGVRVESPGQMLLPHARLSQILSASGDAEMTIESSGDGLTIRGPLSKFKLPAQDPALYPEVPGFDSDAYHAVAAPDLRKAIRRTMFATDPESTRYALGGVLFELSDKALVAVATCGRRLARQEVPAEAEGGAGAPEGKPVVPLKALKLIDRNLADDDPPAHVRILGLQGAVVRAGRATIHTRLVEGRFPRYQDVFPAAPEVKVPLAAGSLLRAVGQAAILTSDESRGVDFRFDGQTLTLTTNAADVGAATITLPAPHEGRAVEITFDVRYLADALKTLDDDAELAAELIDGRIAAILKTTDGYAYVVMPLTRDT